MPGIAETWEGIRRNHRGPYRFLVTRDKWAAGSRAKYQWSGEWLPGEVPSDEVAEEAEALLTDPRDTIAFINVWSVKEEQFAGTLSA